MKNHRVYKFFSRIVSDAVGITIFVIFTFIDPLKRLCDFLYISLYRLLFLEKSIDKLFLEFNPQKIEFETLSDQTSESDVVYRLLQIGEEVRRNNGLAQILSSIISVSDTTNMEQEITQLYGCSHGKSSPSYKLEEFSQEALWESYNGSNRIGFTTEEDWQKNTLSFTRESARDFSLHYYKWNNHCFLSNCDAAHRTAAIFRQAKSQNRSFTIKCHGSEYFINKKLFDQLQQNYHCFLISCNETKWSSCNNKMINIVKRFSLQVPKDFPIYVSTIQKSIDTEYIFFFIKKNTWIESKLLQYCKLLTKQGKSINLLSYISSNLHVQ